MGSVLGAEARECGGADATCDDHETSAMEVTMLQRRNVLGQKEELANLASRKAAILAELEDIDVQLAEIGSVESREDSTSGRRRRSPYSTTKCTKADQDI